MADTNVADCGPAYNMPAVYEATQRAAAYARGGNGPYRNRGGRQTPEMHSSVLA